MAQASWNSRRNRQGRRPLGPASALHATLAVILLTASGCTPFSQWVRNGFQVGPEYCRPAAPVEEQWIDYQRDPRLSDAPVDTSAWWTVFNDPTLNSLIETAASQNLTLREAGTRILQAQAARRIAAGNVFPQVQQAFGGYERVEVSETIANAPPEKVFDNWSQGFNLSWELDFWGRFRRAVEAADATLDASIESYDNVLVLLLSDVAETYVEVRTRQEQLRLVRQNIQLQQDSLRIAQAQFNAGQADASDVLQTRNNVEQTQSLIPELEIALRQANNALCVLLGMPPQDLVAQLGEGPIPTAPADVAVGVPAELLRRRPDVREAERVVAAQSALIGVAESELYPHFAINGVLSWQAQDFGGLFNSASTGGAVGPSFVWNILNYGRLANAVDQQRAVFEEAVYAYQNTVLGAQQEAEDAIVGFLKAQDQTEYQELAVRDIQELNRVLLTQANAGATNFDRVFVVQAAATVQDNDLATSRAEIALNLIRIYRALGGGWQIRLRPQGALAEPALPVDQQDFGPLRLPPLQEQVPPPQETEQP